MGETGELVARIAPIAPIWKRIVTSTKPPRLLGRGLGGEPTIGASTMDERRDPPPEPESSTPDIAADERPTPAQARRAYAKHVNNECARCRDVDRDRCDDGDRLYRVWIDACDDAYRQISGKTS